MLRTRFVSCPHRLCLLIGGALLANPHAVKAQPSGEVLITEFMASNTNALPDDDGEFPDWIELQNVSLPMINLAGWFLTDDPLNLTKWQFPSVSLGRGETLVVFASGKNRTVPGQPLHTSFKLDGSQEYLAVVKPNGVSIAHEYSPNYPPQISDISYGLQQSAVTLVTLGGLAAYRVPSLADAPTGLNWTQIAFDDSSWSSGTSGLGFINTLTSEFEVTVYRANLLVTDLSTAEAVINDPATQLVVSQGTAPWVNFLNTGGTGRYESSIAFPGTTIGTDVNDFVSLVTGSIEIPTAGAWTFGVNSDDGFGLEISRDPNYFTSSFPGTRGPSDTLATFNLPETGVYDVRLVSFDRGGGSGLEFFAAPGSFSSFNAASFDLVGNAASGGIPVVGFAGEVETNLQSSMLGQNASLWTRFEFNVADPAAFAVLMLRVKYLDGFVGFLNGHEVVRRSAPASLAWDSAAASARPIAEGKLFEKIDLTAALPFLQIGANVLAIQALNDTAFNGDFLILPELTAIAATTTSTPTRYFTPSTPGSFNNGGFPGVAGSVSFSHPSQSFSDPLSISLSASVPGQSIRYTNNGVDPTASTGTVYSTPISLTTSTQVRARAFGAGLAPGPVVRRLYSKLDTEVLGVSSDIPIVVVNAFAQPLNPNWYTLSLVAFHDLAPDGRAHLSDPPQFVGHAGLKQRGSSSLGFPKKQYAFEFWDDNNKDTSVSVLGLPSDSDWILYGPYTDKALMRDFLAYRWSTDVGRYAVRTRFVEVYLDSSSGGVSAADYVGVYVFQEKIRRGPDRVDITELLPTDNTTPAVTGGYIFKKDRLDPGDAGFVSSTGQRLAYVEPKENEITTEQAAYLLSYINAFEAALNGPNYADPLLGYAAYIDVDSFIDHHILVEMTKNIDGYRLSTFWHKDRGGKIVMGPIWDYNLSLGNANYLEGWLPQGWYYTQLGTGDYPWFTRLFSDPEFKVRYSDRWFSFRRGPFASTALLDDVDEIAAQLEESQARNYIRWPILGVYVWPNYFIAATYAQEVAWMKQWISDRLTWMDAQLGIPPTFNQQGGQVPFGFEFTLSSPTGDIYYTLDGSDPRLSGGAVSPSASVYIDPVSLTSDTVVMARSLSAGVWSAINKAEFDPLPIAFVNEVLVLNGSMNTDEQGDADPWIELYNPLPSTVDVGGLFLSNDPLFPTKWTIPGATTICGRSWLLVWTDGEPAEGQLHTSFRLLPSDVSIGLYNSAGQPIDLLALPAAIVDVASGRHPDGAPNNKPLISPTPMAANEDDAPLVFLNEYNAVAPDRFLQGTAADSTLGRILGNGGDWFELVVASDHADLRSWQLILTDDTGAPTQTTDILTLSNNSIWSELRGGTIITIAEDQPTDVSYDPEDGDWSIVVQASASSSNTYISNLPFSVSNRNWQLVLKDNAGLVRFGPAGEGVVPTTGVGSDEVCKLEQDASLGITPQSNYRDGVSSTFAAPNVWSGSILQDFSGVRSVIPNTCQFDADCDDRNICTDDTCENGQCVFAFSNTACDDDDGCTDGDACGNGVCSGTAIHGCCYVDCDCDDLNLCTADVCVAGVCQSSPDNEGDPCDDANECTVGDVCTTGLCAGSAINCSYLNDDCVVGACNPSSGSCETQPRPDSTPCDDGFLCTLADACLAGNCVGVPRDCSAFSGPCRLGTCLSSTGQCQSSVINQGSACEDGDPCTQYEVCSTGDCVGTRTCPTVYAAGSRYLAVTPPAGQASVALRIDSAWVECLPSYIDAEGLLSDTPVFRSSSEWGTVFVGDQSVIPLTSYELRADVRLPMEPEALSASVSATTWLWGDVNGVGGINVFDIVCVLDGFQNVFTNCTPQGVDLQGTVPNRDVDLFDIVAVLDGFQTLPYPDADPCAPEASVVAAAHTGAQLYLAARSNPIEPGQPIQLDVYLEPGTEIRGAEIRLRSGGPGPAAGSRGGVVETSRPDFVFHGQDVYWAADPRHNRVALAVSEARRESNDRSYLATFTVDSSVLKPGRYRFGVDVQRSILLDGANRPIYADPNVRPVTVIVRSKRATPIYGASE